MGSIVMGGRPKPKTVVVPRQKYPEACVWQPTSNLLVLFKFFVGYSFLVSRPDTKSGAEHVIPIEAGTHITYDNSVYEHRVDAHPDSKRTLLGPASLPSGGRRLEAVGDDSGCPGPGCGGPPQWFIDGYCPENIQCSTSADCEGLGPEEWNISPFNRKLVEQAEAGVRRLDDTPPSGLPILCIHGLEPLGFGEDGPPGNLRRNLRFGNSGGGNGCCFPFFPFGPIG